MPKKLKIYFDFLCEKAIRTTCSIVKTTVIPTSRISSFFLVAGFKLGSVSMDKVMIDRIIRKSTK